MASDVLPSQPMRDESAERAVLGSMLRDNAVIDDVIQAIVKDDLAIDAHQKIFSAIVGLHADAKPADTVMVADELLRRDHLADTTYSLLATCWDAAPTAANAIYYAGIVRDFAIRRELARKGAQIAQDAMEGLYPAPDLVEMAERAIFDLRDSRGQAGSVPLRDVTAESFHRMSSRAAGGSGSGVWTGFADLDEKLQGLQAGDLCILAARPSCGKTMLALLIAQHVASTRGPVFFASIEQARVELADRLLCAHSGVDSSVLRSGMLTSRERDDLDRAREVLDAVQFDIDSHPRQTVGRIASNGRRLKARHGLWLVVIDYIGLIEPDDRRIPRHEQVSAISRRLKQVARELAVPVLALCQLKRESEDRADGKPRLSDLRESGSLEQDADTVILMNRAPQRGHGSAVLVEINVAKQRNGPTGECTLEYLKHCMRFRDYAESSGIPD